MTGLGLQEWIGHRDLTTTQRYADYAPSAREAELVAAAFTRTDGKGGAGFYSGSMLSESEEPEST